MRNFDRSFIVCALVLVGVACAPVIACSSTTDDGGVIVPVEGGPAAATCTDGLKNPTETDVDCGGVCAKCKDGKGCTVGTDCNSGVCKDAGTGLQCQAPNNKDGVKNGNETGTDCGGMSNPKCANGHDCTARADCTSDYCTGGRCTATSPTDGVQNGSESDVDCGGTGNARCLDALKCLVDDDCKSDVCKDLKDGKDRRCQVPTYGDGKLNGLETDVDCGGDAAHACATGKTCKVGGDCTTLGCNYKFKCAAGRSCTNPGGWGADTCGYGGEGPPAMVAAKDWHDCCEKAPVTASTGPTADVTVQLDKYEVTAGRMRVFLESVGYDVRGFVQAARAAGKIPLIPGNATASVLEADWDLYLPVSFAGNQNAGELVDCDQGGAISATSTTCKPGFEIAGLYTSVRNHLGGTIFKGNNQSSTGCHIGTATGGGTHAFRFPAGTADPPSGTPGIDQNSYDEKGMNCIDYLVGQAFCVWDGGRLELGQEQIAAWGPEAMPWAADTTKVPATPGDRQALLADGTPATCTAGTQAAIDLQCDPTGAVKGAYSCTVSKCVLKGGDKTYWGCRFPWATDAVHAQCGLTWPDTRTIEYADYQYSYEYPKADSTLNANDYIIFISAPGRTRGRGPAGHADIIGNLPSLTSNVTEVNADPQLTKHGWSSNGSWEVHNYSKPASGLGTSSNLLNKYGKLGLRCAYP